MALDSDASSGAVRRARRGAAGEGKRRQEKGSFPGTAATAGVAVRGGMLAWEDAQGRGGPVVA